MNAEAAKKEAPSEAPKNETLESAHKIVRTNMYFAMGIGVVPYPIVDIIGIAGFQLKAIKELSDLYGITFNEHKVKNIVASLISGFAAPWLGGLLFGSVVKILPGLGTFVGITKVPIAAGAVTYGVGRVFIQHFESGGTFLNLDPDKVREYFEAQVKEGMNKAEEAVKGAKKSASSAASS